MPYKNIFTFLFFIALAISTHLFLAQGINSGVQIPHFDKFAHFVVFFGLALLLDLSFSMQTTKALGLALVYGISIELMQSTVPGREASIADIVFDLVGSACYYYLVQNWLRIQIKKTVQHNS